MTSYENQLRPLFGLVSAVRLYTVATVRGERIPAVRLVGPPPDLTLIET
jgi:hypothetical protein